MLSCACRMAVPRTCRAGQQNNLRFQRNKTRERICTLDPMVQPSFDPDPRTCWSAQPSPAQPLVHQKQCHIHREGLSATTREGNADETQAVRHQAASHSPPPSAVLPPPVARLRMMAATRGPGGRKSTFSRTQRLVYCFLAEWNPLRICSAQSCAAPFLGPHS
ncbi:hypothetical protein BD289DRAFT_79073 [Coniella lustricola]|uniref:Uncharacterized protein n=1 Tax=Coniella lustricola TaxID=2025994 RepID=A0A2T2ZZ55_9PEZI|nr:hypothetical protein BD289DRAFT_79073 [Coniella lustricola]